jgi:hypothetical protein
VEGGTTPTARTSGLTREGATDGLNPVCSKALVPPMRSAFLAGSGPTQKLKCTPRTDVDGFHVACDYPAPTSGEGPRGCDGPTRKDLETFGLPKEPMRR